jgi:hypothetical protein
MTSDGVGPRTSLALRLGAALVFWIAVLLIQKFNWGLGVEKAVVLAVLLLATPLVVVLAERRRPVGDAAAPRAVAVAVAVLLVAQAGYAAKELRHPSLIDAATTTLAAGEVLRGGASPYATALDPEGMALLVDPRFGGYKYLPMTIAAYLPLGAPLGQRGIVLTNLLMQLAMAWLILRLGIRIAGVSGAWLGLLFYLSLPLVPFQLFAKGATDLVAVLPLLAALLLFERRPGLAGLCLGLALAAKPLPGVLLLPCCLPEERPARIAYATGVAAGLLPVLPFLVWSPAALYDNVVQFNLTRPADSTSWLAAAAPLAGAVAHAVLALLYAGVAVHIWLRPPTLLRRTGAAVGLTLAAILAAPAAHHNYQLWWLPLVAPLLAAALAPSTAPAVYEAPKVAA